MLKGKGVTLRAMEHEDLEKLRVMRNEHLWDNIFRQYRPLTSADQERYWNNVVNHENFVVFVITIPKLSETHKEIAVFDGDTNPRYFKKEEDQVIGEVRAGYINWRNRWAELGIFLGKEHMGHGYGRDALYLLLDYAFNNLNLHAIRAETVTPKVADLFREFMFTDIGQTHGTTFKDGEFKVDYILEVYVGRWFQHRKEIYATAVEPHVEPAPQTF